MRELDAESFEKLVSGLSELTRHLNALSSALSDRGGAITDILRLKWSAGSLSNHDFRGKRAGIVIYAELGEQYVGFNPNAGTAEKCVLTLTSKRWVALPREVTNISIGGAVAGRATVIALAKPPMIAGGVY